MTAPTGARFHRVQRHHRRLAGQWRRDLRQVRAGAREWGGAAVDAVQFIVEFGGYLLLRLFVASAAILVATFVMGAGR